MFKSKSIPKDCEDLDGKCLVDFLTKKISMWISIIPKIIYKWYMRRSSSKMKNELVTNVNGDKYWYLNGKYHRENGPAIECSNGHKAWYLNGKRHRENGPAVEYPSGTKKYYLNGKLHREDGPAVEYSDGYKSWWLNGKKLSNYRIIRWFEKRNMKCLK